jgi:hypothetical protein
VVAVQSATGRSCLQCWCTDQEVDVLEFHMLWDASLDCGITSTAATQTRRYCILSDKCVNTNNFLLPWISISIIMYSHIMLPNICISCNVFQGVII